MPSKIVLLEMRSVPEQAQLVLGIDPGLANMGWALVDMAGGAILSSGTISTEGPADLPRRSAEQATALGKVVPADGALLIAIEAHTYIPGSRASAMLAASFGVAVGVATSSRCTVAPIHPAMVRKVLSLSAKASRRSLKLRWPRRARPTQHEIDAAAIAKAGFFLLKARKLTRSCA